MSRALPPNWREVGIARHGSGTVQVLMLAGGLITLLTLSTNNFTEHATKVDRNQREWNAWLHSEPRMSFTVTFRDPSDP
ncbi:MAG: hypothetical protein IH987_09385 [Planctomycetes bacterium]|nr:hypothetical protein [Planctomycetota bacterium]